MIGTASRTQVLAFCVLVGLAACGGRGTQPPAGRGATTTSGSSPLPSITTTLDRPPETKPSDTSSPTTSTSPPEPWQIDGRAYYFPVQPPEVASYGPEHHDYPATDIFAPSGATLVAATGGVVDEAGTIDSWDPAIDDPATRGGLYVSIVGSDGVRYYYSHLSRVEAGIAAGVTVQAGRVIGAVGNSGNARDTPSHVHFGLSPPTFPGDWMTRRGTVAPYPYLSAWEVGTQMRPEMD